MMLNEKQLSKIAIDEVISTFGKDYLKKNFGNTCLARGMTDSETFMFFAGIKMQRDLPNMKANEKGWAVYASVYVDATSGKIVRKDFQLEQ